MFYFEFCDFRRVGDNRGIVFVVLTIEFDLYRFEIVFYVEYMLLDSTVFNLLHVKFI